MPADTVFDPTDKGTLRPNDPAIQEFNTSFVGMDIEDRPTQIILPEGVYPDQPYDLFKLYYTDMIILSLVEATNRYKRVIQDTPKGRARGSNWYPTTPQEICIFLAIRIYMTIHVENKIGDY